MSATVIDFSQRRTNVLGRVSGCGSIRFCPKCGLFGLQFGTVHLRIAPRELLDLCARVDDRMQRLRDDGYPTEQTQIAIRDSTATLVVWPGQLFSLRELLGYGVDLAASARASTEMDNWSN